MLKRLYPPLRPQSVGEVLDTGFQIFAASLIKTLPYGVVMILAGQLGNIYNLASGRPLGRFTPRDLPSSIVYVVSLVALSALFMAMMLRQRAIAQGEPTSMRAELLSALSRVPAQLAMFLLTSLVVLLGFVLLILPGLYLAVALSMAFPALVLERQGHSKLWIQPPPGTRQLVAHAGDSLRHDRDARGLLFSRRGPRRNRGPICARRGSRAGLGGVHGPRHRPGRLQHSVLRGDDTRAVR